MAVVFGSGGSGAGWRGVGLAIALFAAGGAAHAQLRLTEVMMNGTGAGEPDEWIEIVNLGPDAVDLSSYRIGDEETPGGTEGFYAFPATNAAPGEVIIVARNATAFAASFTVPAGTRVFASAEAAPELTLSKDTLLGTGEIGLGNGSSTSGDEVLLLRKVAEGVYQLADGVSYGGTGAVTTYAPPGGTAVTFIDARVTDLPGELQSLARISALVDADAAADWAVRLAPTPGTVPLNICGDGVLEAGEGCDDGGTLPDDGCSASCEVECGFTCVGAGPGSCGEDCGDGDVAGLEECDDGGTLPGDGCDALCHVEPGFVCTDPEPLCDAAPGTRSACALDPCLVPLRVTEVHADGFVDSESEWIELTNLGTLPVDLAAWSFGDQATQGASGEGMIRFAPGMVLSAGRTIVLANSGARFQTDFADAADYEYGVDSTATIPYLHRQSDWSPNTNIQLDNGADQVLLACGGVARDIVRWGPADALTVPVPSGEYSAATPDAGPLTIERLGGADSGTAADWAISRCPSPGVAPNPNRAPEAAPSLITALPGVATTFVLAAFDPDGDALAFAIDTTGTLGLVEDLGDGLVRYTPPAGSGSFGTSFSFAASDACSTSTPATVELRVGTPACDPKLAKVRLTEVHADARVDNDGEWIELTNTASSSVDLGFLRLGDEESTAGSEGMVVFRPGTLLAAGDAFVVAFSAAAFRDDWDLAADGEWYRDSDGVDNDLPHATASADGVIRLDNSDDGVVLVGCDGAVLDALYWGHEAPSGTPRETPWPLGARATPAWDGLTSLGPATLARRDPAVDTNGPGDWYVSRCPTPGLPKDDNAAPLPKDAAYPLAVGAVLSKSFAATDPDSSTLAFSATADQGTVTVTDAATGAFTYRPPAGASGVFTITFEVSDGCASAAGIVHVCVSQSAVEVCDAADVDEDCDGFADDLDPQGNATGKTTFYRDDDGDGVGRSSASQSRCDAPPGWVAEGGDCDDDPARCGDACSPELLEAKALGNCGDGWDNDCDGATDQGPGCSEDILCYLDRDGDGFGRFASETIVSGSAADLGCAGYLDGVNPAGSWVDNGLDCDDDPTACGAACHPGAPDLCDGRDEDCDPASADGADDPAVGAACDAAFDADLCPDDRSSCEGGAIACVNIAANDAARVEVCDPLGTDEDCDGGADDADPEGSPLSAPLWYRDEDGDGFGSPSQTLRRCTQPAGFVASATDCDDSPGSCGADCHPGAVEDCDGVDNDCSAATADGSGDKSVGLPCDSDEDADHCLDEVMGCEDGALVCPNNPDGDGGRVEVCGAGDEDCDGGADDDDPDGVPEGAPTYYADRDGDGFGDDAVTRKACLAPAGYVAVGGDCDDDPTACGARCSPGHEETGEACADGIDNDCDGRTDTDPGCGGGPTCFADADHDGFGQDAVFIAIPPAQVALGGCATWDDGTHPPGYWASLGGDCDDGDASVSPGAPEVVGNDKDEDCSGRLACWVDADNDNYALDTAAVADAPLGEGCAEAFHLAPVQGDCEDNLDGCGAGCSPAAIEICDHLDNDCDQAIDEGTDCEGAATGVVSGGEGCAGGGASLLSLIALVLARARARRS